MTYTIVTVPTARKSLKKLPKPIQKSLIEKLSVLKTDTNAGEQLERPFQAFRSFHTAIVGTQYRVVYEVDPHNQQIIVRYAATRENFYKQLRQLKLSPVA